MIAAVLPIAALLLSVFVLLLGNGLHGTMLPIRANIESFSSLAIGVLGASYFLGYVVGCFGCPYAVKRVGHIRAFITFGTMASAAAIAHALIIDEMIWWVLRFLTGVCFAGLYMVIESWLNERSTVENRGRVLSVYQIVNLGALALGQQLLNLANPETFKLFGISSILVSLALIPVALSTAMAPAPLKAVRVRLKWLYGISPVGVIGCAAVGLANGAFWALGPVFAQRSLLSVPEIATFMSATIIGGAILQYPLGRLSDQIDRRWTIIIACIGAAAVGAALTLFSGVSGTALLVLSCAYGGFAFPLYALCIAHANDAAGPEDFVDVSSGLLLVFGIGAVAGPLAASAAMEFGGHAALFSYTATIHLAAALFAYYRMKKRLAIAPDDRENFVAVPLTTPAVSEIVPLASVDTGDPPLAGNFSAPPEAPDLVDSVLTDDGDVKD